ncbi:hypothetical protein DFH06DRAFT_1346748 [Mycena polygramma]|nr:hypothetical protein DFH06DRAFT_1346748 [Mycena polygramma]
MLSLVSHTAPPPRSFPFAPLAHGPARTRTHSHIHSSTACVAQAAPTRAIRTASSVAADTSTHPPARTPSASSPTPPHTVPLPLAHGLQHLLTTDCAAAQSSASTCIAAPTHQRRSKRTNTAAASKRSAAQAHIPPVASTRVTVAVPAHAGVQPPISHAYPIAQFRLLVEVAGIPAHTRAPPAPVRRTAYACSPMLLRQGIRGQKDEGNRGGKRGIRRGKKGWRREGKGKDGKGDKAEQKAEGRRGDSEDKAEMMRKHRRGEGTRIRHRPRSPLALQRDSISFPIAHRPQSQLHLSPSRFPAAVAAASSIEPRRTHVRAYTPIAHGLQRRHSCQLAPPQSPTAARTQAHMHARVSRGCRVATSHAHTHSPPAPPSGARCQP